MFLKGASKISFFRFLLLCCSTILSKALSLKPELEYRAENGSVDYQNLTYLADKEFPKKPDFVQCDGYYGYDLQKGPCEEAYEQVWSNVGSIIYLIHGPKRPYGVRSFIVPVKFSDDPGEPI